MSEPRVYLLYHFFHPDDVISARLFTELGVSLVARGCEVTAMPVNARCHDYRARLPYKGEFEGIKIRRIYRPAFSQHRVSGRLINTLFVLGGWTWRSICMRRSQNEVMVVGTDPILAVLVTIVWRLFRPKSRIIHWCHDLYPDAAIADGLLTERSLINRILRRLLRIAYRRCDLIADLGPCMRSRLLRAFTDNPPVFEKSGKIPNESAEESVDQDDAQRVFETDFQTLIPWSLVEPCRIVEPNPPVRNDMFDQSARLGILYSGNLGRAHHFESVLALARTLRQDNIGFCFAGRGPGIEELRSSIKEADANIRFAGFADESELLLRLTATDVHLVTLRESWTGTVVPSKFFGALAVGRPVLFAGSEESAIAYWIKKYRIGWVLSEHSHNLVVDELREHSESAGQIAEMRNRCWEIYQQKFSKKSQLDQWHKIVLGR